MSTEKFKALIKEEAMKLFKEGEEIKSLGNATDLDMNSMDKVDNSGGSKVASKKNGGFETKTNAPKAAGNIEDEKEPVSDVKMNGMDKDQGHDEKIAAAAKVSAASSTMSGPSTEGMHNSDFESKKGNQSTDASGPFEDRIEDPKMNSQDKNIDDVGAKTFVEPGADVKGGEAHTTGQKKAVSSEKAKNEKETKERIAKGIQLPEGFKTTSEFVAFINEESSKISKLL